ncbi:putative metallopeptidase [Gluconacetobacter entanii]|uniref:Metallopeptidase n=2 Tax=Acetobacteraceae TaxID=433 RepID=A0ABT3K2G9_9PROT|nr:MULTISPECIES: putative metallopeptidase [Acetobacteraceae]MCW4589603.1 putative metallopeptidase [Gluconacetobacter entanii]MCW4593029.1 putative metallopeptidase [Gluconacetobacter entanii]NPC89191.1 hypothetical protein [Gluconacetobacter entanii]GAN83833.1 hypothetical protein Gaha_0105_068 [Novacetimonas hansenii JCM 7643]GBQ62841.1 hypothetical protein AA0243_2975 [Novacetimonas hansenii NRIC 0243]
MSDDEEFEAFSAAPETEDSPLGVMTRLIDTEGMFSFLKTGEVRIAVFMRHFPKEKQGRIVLGELALPRFQGGLARLGSWLLQRATWFQGPDYILMIDQDWWDGARPEAQEALVFHELMHAEHAVDRDGELKFDDEGRPVWSLKGHDLEEFREVVRRYGDWSGEIGAFVDAARIGGVT